MNLFFRAFLYISILLLIPINICDAQKITGIRLSSDKGIITDGFYFADSSILTLRSKRPLYSLLLNKELINSGNADLNKKDKILQQFFNNTLQVSVSFSDSSANYWKTDLHFSNTGKDTVALSNIVPYGEDPNTIHITGKGPADLARAYLFRPGYSPLRVILPDNAWESGYSSFSSDNGKSVCALARRILADGAIKKRYETILPPGASVKYVIYTEVFTGEWQNGLKKIFRDRLMYDVESFDNTLYNRKDIAWIKDSYIIVLQMAWDREFFDRFSGRYTYGEQLRNYQSQFGKIDVFGIWPTWPRLGLDQRNQWDLYRDMPGGTEQLRNFSNMSKMAGTKFFIAYNPWDNSTKREDHFSGMAKVIAETEADGVILDTKGNSAAEIQQAADSVRDGVVMYSEGMAVPADMEGIISGRVHNALFLSPELNINKLIKPDFAIFRVCDVGEDILHREIAVSFFNGYGTELNMFRPGGRGESFEDDKKFLARTTFILRQNSDAFLDKDWTPLINSSPDMIHINRWKSDSKIIYTILSMRPEGFRGNAFSTEGVDSLHYVSLWHHEELTRDNSKSGFLRIDVPGWDTSFTGTRREGAVDCIAGFRNLLKSEIKGDSVYLRSALKGLVTVWKGNPGYNTIQVSISSPCDTVIRIKDLFGYYDGKIVVQLLNERKLKDEKVLRTKSDGKPWLISRVNNTIRAISRPDEMVLIPGAKIQPVISSGDEFIPYPDLSGKEYSVDSFLIDRYPVTNEQYYDFVLATGYRPSDTTSYLSHWNNGVFRQGQDKYPVVNISFEDMNAYARWAGKRLPTQAEWQLAAQGTDGRRWPWGNDFHGTYCNNSFERLTPVDAFPKGQSQYGVMDLVGNVWQMTGDIYFNGSYYIGIIRGGSYFKPDSSEWYIQGGPQPLDKSQILLMVYPGFDRSSTVGFRCVKDIDGKNFKSKK